MTDANDRNEREITLSVSYRVRPGREEDFEAYLRSITEAASRFPGYRGIRVLHPAGKKRRYRTIFSFTGRENLERWRDSDERQYWRARGEELEEEKPRIANITGTAQEHPLALTVAPLVGFLQTSVSGIGLLLLGTIVALVMANSPLSDWYEQLWTTDLTIGVLHFGITESLRNWVDDALMALFFFIIGLEIKREILVGDLQELRHATLPIAAAVGGAVTPALIYTTLNFGGGTEIGWGVPIGTDTAFTIGILTLFGNQVQSRLRVFLTAFSIVDDILAVLVIAAFYTEEIDWRAVGVAVLLLGVLAFANRAGFHRWPIYAFVGIGVWLAVFESGIHGTVAGVLVAMTVPARSWINPSEFIARGTDVLEHFKRSRSPGQSMLSNNDQQQAVQAMERLTRDVETPMTHLGHQVNPWVTYGVLPLFAFANAGIVVTSGLGEALTSPVTWGVILGLVAGKPLGIIIFAWLAVRMHIAVLAEDIAWKHIAGVAALGGIGFTMSLFITGLAFGGSPAANDARVGILAGSLVAGLTGYLVLNTTLPTDDADPASE